MTGPEHYRKAEILLAGSVQRVTPWGDTGWVAPTPEQVARAQVHATLALAAATARAATQIWHSGGSMAAMPSEDAEAWQDAAGVKS